MRRHGSLGSAPSVSLTSLPSMDWQGQKLAEQLMQILLLSFAVVAFTTGYFMASFQMMILTYFGGVVLTTLVTVPNWPFYNRHPLEWLDPSEVEKHPKPQPSANSTSKKKPVKK
ncbi:hypothetical protein Ahy_B07g088656 [Arachis hypogaea]|uniref:Signal peptidase complex subunit 1 n=2 Tax=Arachis hypogaea TaxID=3818 RepID=A0A444YF60_ARAHY|nr:hypothetical protein Ahy_B07g088656 [Arachis hypogaea]